MANSTRAMSMYGERETERNAVPLFFLFPQVLTWGCITYNLHCFLMSFLLGDISTQEDKKQVDDCCTVVVCD